MCTHVCQRSVSASQVAACPPSPDPAFERTAHSPPQTAQHQRTIMRLPPCKWLGGSHIKPVMCDRTLVTNPLQHMHDRVTHDWGQRSIWTAPPCPSIPLHACTAAHDVSGTLTVVRPPPSQSCRLRSGHRHAEGLFAHLAMTPHPPTPKLQSSELSHGA